MAKFKVGDRARIIKSCKDKRTGKECTILHVGPYATIYGNFDYLVSVDGELISAPAMGLPEGEAFYDDQLEPITELGSWDEIEKATGWKPVVKKSFTTEKSI